MFTELAPVIPWFLAGSTLVMLVFVAIGSYKSRVEKRLSTLADGNQAAEAAMELESHHTHPGVTLVDNPLDRWTDRRMKRDEQKEGVKERMVRAGFYAPKAVVIFTIMRGALLLGPVAAGFLLSTTGDITLRDGLLLGGIVGILGTLAPGFWLDYVKRKRQTQIRRALPDALDVLVVCLEGGLSVPSSFSRVGHELVTAHPMLAMEFLIIEKQSQLGRTTGEAVRQFADRFDLEELRSMASVVIQAESIGSSVVTALEVFAHTLRQRRSQHAEEKAQKAAIKMLFPTVLFIFPAIFVVILGPAAIQIYEVLGNMNK